MKMVLMGGGGGGQKHFQLVLHRQDEDKTMQTFLHKELLNPSHRISLEGIARDQVKVDDTVNDHFPRQRNFRGSWDW